MLERPWLTARHPQTTCLRRSRAAVTAAVTLVLSFTLLGFTYISPAVSLTFYSISLTIGPIALISSVPHILPLTAVGTALGMYKCAINIGATIMDPIVGFIIDIYNKCAGPRLGHRWRAFN